VPLHEAIFAGREDRLKPTPDIKALGQSTGSKFACTERGRQAMKWSLLMVAFLALAYVATFVPIRSTPPMLLSNADGVEWKCSKSALILTSCAPNRDVRFTSMN
jgi:hypothetical protein